MKPIAKIHDDGYWTALPGFREPRPFGPIEVYAAPAAPPWRDLTDAQLDAIWTHWLRTPAVRGGHEGLRYMLDFIDRMTGTGDAP
jgi:hypothetical protein